jgi:hypothetical protein
MLFYHKDDCIISFVFILIIIKIFLFLWIMIYEIVKFYRIYQIIMNRKEKNKP